MGHIVTASLLDDETLLITTPDKGKSAGYSFASARYDAETCLDLLSIPGLPEIKRVAYAQGRKDNGYVGLFEDKLAWYADLSAPMGRTERLLDAGANLLGTGVLATAVDLWAVPALMNWLKIPGYIPAGQIVAPLLLGSAMLTESRDSAKKDRESSLHRDAARLYMALPKMDMIKAGEYKPVQISP